MAFAAAAALPIYGVVLSLVHKHHSLLPRGWGEKGELTPFKGRPQEITEVVIKGKTFSTLFVLGAYRASSTHAATVCIKSRFNRLLTKSTGFFPWLP